MAQRRIAVSIMPGCRGRVTIPELRRVTRYVLDSECAAPEVEAEVVLADVATVRDLNRLYRGKDDPADVLSFGANEGESFLDAPDATPSLGEIIICVPVAEASVEGKEGLTVSGAISHLLVHGLLHLLAYDHEDADDSAAMQSREEALLGDLGYAGQYEHGH